MLIQVHLAPSTGKGTVILYKKWLCYLPLYNEIVFLTASIRYAGDYSAYWTTHLPVEGREAERKMKKAGAERNGKKSTNCCESKQWKLETWLSSETTWPKWTLFGIHVDHRTQVTQVLHHLVKQTEKEKAKGEMPFSMIPKICCPSGEVQPSENIQHVIYLWNVLWPAFTFNRGCEKGESLDVNANVPILFE